MFVLDPHGGFVASLGRDVFDESDDWQGPRGVGAEAELDADGAQAFTEDDDWNEWVGRQVLTLTGVAQAADTGPDRSKWALLMIAFAGLTAALSGRRPARRVSIIT